MIYAIISDIHGNLESLLKVVEKIKSHKEIEKVICLGDIVGYGADPEKCIQITKKISDVILAGNHDFAACGMTNIEVFNPFAKQAVLWTRKVLDYREINFLKNLPLKSSMENMDFVHSSLYRPEEWRYLLSASDTYIDFQIMEKDILFIGHSHTPLVFENKVGKVKTITKEEMNLQPEGKYIINPGSVGQPRDGDPRASFVIFDSKKNHLQRIRLEYDILEAQRKIREANLPEILAERLSYGM
ncbi:MAG: metallophosphoesterase family protein [candidate division WOR-3 bacterium]|nr:metallophosphoesterase family protein [candidate division WOR-3 bacterium]